MRTCRFRLGNRATVTIVKQTEGRSRCRLILLVPMRIEQPKGQGGPVLSLRWLRSKKKIKAMMKQSIRNELPGTVKTIISDEVLSEVVIETGIGEIASVITTSSVEQMGLKVGDEVFALVKATNVS